MKTTVISNNNYKGVRSYYGKPNKLTRIFYAAKFWKDNRALQQLTKLAEKELKDVIANTGVNYITAVNNVLSKYNMPKMIAKALAKKYGIVYLEIFKDANQKLNVDEKKITGKTIIVIDDVIYSGSTMKRALYLLRKAKVKTTFFYTMLKSPSFKK